MSTKDRIKPTAEPAALTRRVKKMLMALQTNDCTSFTEEASDGFKRVIEQLFQDSHQRHSARMNLGYECVYLGTVRRVGCQTHLWKLVYRDGGDDDLIHVVLEAERVNAFWFQ
jgi:hypothetical protein